MVERDDEEFSFMLIWYVCLTFRKLYIKNYMHQLALEQRGRLSFNSEQYLQFLKNKTNKYIYYIYGSHFLKCKYLEINIKFLLYINIQRNNITF